jgi:hypothetical protein
MICISSTRFSSAFSNDDLHAWDALLGVAGADVLVNTLLSLEKTRDWSVNEAIADHR